MKKLLIAICLLAGVLPAQNVLLRDFSCQDAGANDTYTCSLPVNPTSYATGQLYRFKANTANTGAASINFNSIGAATIKKVVGGITSDLSDNDIRVGQWITLVYDGTNMQMQSMLGNSPAATGDDTAYNEGTWNGSTAVPTQNAVRDHFEALAPAGVVSKAAGGTGADNSSVTFPSAGAITVTIASGTKALDTDAISSTACDTLSTTTATGVASTDVIIITPNADITSVTGYTAATTGGLQIWAWPTTNTINWKVCNPTSSSITPGAVTLNYRVVR